MKERIIFIDFGIFLHRAIFAWRNNKSIPATYTCLNMIIANLMRIGLTPIDKVIVAIDSKFGSWRKEIAKEYKGNRKAQRESFEDINWKQMYSDFGYLIEQLKESTPFYYIDIEKLEADDIIAHGIKIFSDKECIIISYDKDFEQLLVYDNVKIFSPHPKAKKCPYKILSLDRNKEKQKALTTLAQKISKEASDNLTTRVENETDFDQRNLIVSLLELPEFVTSQVEKELSNLNRKNYTLENLPFVSLRKRFMRIYNSDKIISYADCIKRKEKDKKKKQGNKLSKYAKKKEVRKNA